MKLDCINGDTLRIMHVLLCLENLACCKSYGWCSVCVRQCTRVARKTVLVSLSPLYDCSCLEELIIKTIPCPLSWMKYKTPTEELSSKIHIFVTFSQIREKEFSSIYLEVTYRLNIWSFKCYLNVINVFDITSYNHNCILNFIGW